MIGYFVSNVFHNTVLQAIQRTDENIGFKMVGDDIFIYDEIKLQLSTFGQSINKMIIDLNAVKDDDDNILEALEMIRTMYDNIRIIILAADHKEGDLILSKSFAMSIYDIITTSDYIEIEDELKYCIETGKKYREAYRYKDAAVGEKVSIKAEIRQVVSKVTVGIIGTQKRIGTTHQMIVLGNLLRSHGFRVAMIEKNNNQAFEYIRDSFECKQEDRCFKFENNDYYASNSKDEGIILTVMQNAYNFIITDYGCYNELEDEAIEEFNKQDIKIVVCGSKPWETNNLNALFANNSTEVLKEYNYLFNFISEEESGKYLRENMGELNKVYFSGFQSDPFNSIEFAGEEIFKKYLTSPDDKPEKRKLFNFRKR